MPFEDLAKLIKVREGLRVIDLGCGTGELTERLSDILPASEVLGIDKAPQMLEQAVQRARPGLRFELASIENVLGEWDLVFSNAALQWVNDHTTLIPSLFSLVCPEGQLVVQVPRGHRALGLMREIAAQEPFRSALGGWERKSPVLSVEDYAELLYEHGGREITAFEKVYPHILENSDAIAEWAAGTGMLSYFERLPKALHEPLMSEFRRKLRENWPAAPVFFGFKRILFAASKAP